jgi:hypothetical protein
VPNWRVYSRSGCCLCERMIEELTEILGPAAVSHAQVIDIEGDPVLEQRYGTRIPVLTLDDEFVCCYQLDRDRVRRILEAG